MMHRIVKISLLFFGLLALPALPIMAHDDFDVVDNQDYIAICGDCHVAHQPQFMPARSWNYFLTNKGLNDHFGVKVDSKEKDLQAIYDYLKAADSSQSDNKTIKRIERSYNKNTIPIRITTNRHYEKMHRKILDDEQKFVHNNPKVQYMGDCKACHEDALTGDFSERSVKIPGFQKSDWD